MIPEPNQSRFSRRVAVAVLAASATLAITGCTEKRVTPPVPAAPMAASSQVPLDETVFRRVVGVICEIIGTPKVPITAGQELSKDLGADDLDLVEIVMALEEEFHFAIADADAEKMRTVGDLVSYVQKYAKP